MSTIDRPGERFHGQPVQLDPPPVYLEARAEFAARYLYGEGLEIGALHQPLAMPPHARVRYVDRMKTDELRREYPELAEWDLTDVAVVDDGETLATIPAASQDFIIANHFLEHTENPIGTIETHLGKLKPGGILFYAVPDKRYTLDFRRPVTPLEHMIADYEEGPERSRAEHYTEWCRLVINEESTGTAEEAASEELVSNRAKELDDAKYSIHMHAWTQAEFLQLILACRERFGNVFDIEATARRAIEFMVVLRKQGAWPPPSPAGAGSSEGAPTLSGKDELRNVTRRALGKARREVRRWRARP
jgi:predicted SAM-dependent methyltransferase